MSTEENNTDQNPQNGEKLDNRVIPVMREAVALVQMVLFREVKDKLADKYQGWESGEYKRFVGCLVNDVFGTPAQDQDSVAFARHHLETVEGELKALAGNVPEILPYLTDALRMQTLCDREEGINTLPTLLRARALGLLIEERTIPMPSTFMILIRQFGEQYGLLESMQPGANGEASAQPE